MRRHGTQHDDIHHNDTHHNNIYHNVTQHNDIYHNAKLSITALIMLNVIYAECQKWGRYTECRGAESAAWQPVWPDWANFVLIVIFFKKK
jgi:hypothetical protein